MAETPSTAETGSKEADQKELETFLKEFKLESLKSKFVKSEIPRPLHLLCSILSADLDDDHGTDDSFNDEDEITPGMQFDEFCYLFQLTLIEKLQLKSAVMDYMRRRKRLKTECHIRQQTYSNLHATHILNGAYVKSRYRPEEQTLFSFAILGHTYAGKTSMLKRLALNRFDEEGDVTLGIDLTSLYVAIDPDAEAYPVAHLCIWDTNGTERFRHSLSDQYYRGKDAFIFVYDVCDERSFDRIQEWHNDMEERVDKEEVIRVLVGNKTDLLFDQTQFTTGDADVIRTKAAALASRLGMTLFEVSSKTGQNMVDMIVETTRQVFEFQKVKRYIVPPSRGFSLDQSVFSDATDAPALPKKLKSCCLP